MGGASWYGYDTRLLVQKTRYQAIRLDITLSDKISRYSTPPSRFQSQAVTLACDPMPRIQWRAWDSPDSCSRSAKWAWGWLESGCHRPILDLCNRRLKERGNIGAHETRLQVHSPEFKVGSVAPRPRAGPMPILLSANRNLENINLGITSQDPRLGIRNALSGAQHFLLHRKLAFFEAHLLRSLQEKWSHHFLKAVYTGALYPVHTPCVILC